jgi:hypothetical protein
MCGVPVSGGVVDAQSEVNQADLIDKAIAEASGNAALAAGLQATYIEVKAPPGESPCALAGALRRLG